MHQSTELTPLAQALMHTYRHAIKSFMHFNKVQGVHHLQGCKPSELRVLFLLRDIDEQGMKVSEISKRLQVTSPTVTQVLKGLEANGLVARQNDPTDRRAVGIVLTQRGERVIRQAEEVFASSFQGLAEYLGKEESHQLIELLSKSFQYFDERNTELQQVSWNGDDEV